MNQIAVIFRDSTVEPVSQQANAQPTLTRSKSRKILSKDIPSIDTVVYARANDWIVTHFNNSLDAQDRTELVAKSPNELKHVHQAVFNKDKSSGWKRFKSFLAAQAQTPVNVVICSSAYQVLQVEKPHVPAEELIDAIRWAAQEQLPKSIEEYEIDVIEMPGDVHTSQQNMCYVVVAERKHLMRMLEPIVEAGFYIDTVSIPELQIGKWLTDHLGDAAVACVTQGDQHIRLTLYRHGSLYITRESTDLKNWQDAAQDTDRFVLALQRSIDYFEGQLGQPPVSKIYFFKSERFESEWVESLKQNWFSQIEVVTCSDRKVCSNQSTLAAIEGANMQFDTVS